MPSSSAIDVRSYIAVLSPLCRSQKYKRPPCYLIHVTNFNRTGDFVLTSVPQHVLLMTYFGRSLLQKHRRRGHSVARSLLVTLCNHHHLTHRSLLYPHPLFPLCDERPGSNLGCIDDETVVNDAPHVNCHL